MSDAATPARWPRHTPVVILKRADTDPPPRGTWKEAARDGVPDHSLSCPLCEFDQFVRLEGWQA